MAPRIVFAGAYGIRSQGDDAAMLVLWNALRNRYPDLQGGVVCRHASEKLYEPYGLESLPNFEYDRKEDSLGKWFRGFNYADDRSDLKRLYGYIEQSDLLVLGAGNALVDYTIGLLRGPIPYFVLLSLMAKMARVPVMWFGISVGPIRTEYGRSLTRLAASLADLVTVRDEQSLTLFRELNCEGSPLRLPDPVLGLRSKSPGVSLQVPGGSSRVAVSVRALPDSSGLSHQSYVLGMAKVCDRLVEQWGLDIIFVPQCTYTHGAVLEDDRAVAMDVVKNMTHPQRATVVDRHLSVEETCDLYNGALAAICTRLHGCVSATLAGVPTLAVSYNPKVMEFMRWLGKEEFVVSLEVFSETRLFEKFQQLWSRRESFVRETELRVAAGQVEVAQYAELADRLLSRSLLSKSEA